MNISKVCDSIQVTRTVEILHHFFSFHVDPVLNSRVVYKLVIYPVFKLVGLLLILQNKVVLFKH